MSELALSRVRIRRFPRPPKRLVYFAVCVLRDAMWLFYWFVEIANPNHPGLPVPIKVFGAMVWILCLARDYWQLQGMISAYLNNRKLASVTRKEWRYLVWSTSLALLCCVTVLL